MKQIACLGLSLLVLLTACAASPVIITATPHPTATLPVKVVFPPRPTPTRTITPTPVYVGDLVSPEGKAYAKRICYQGYAQQWDCETHFPNGNIFYGTPGENGYSSPDRRYAIQPVGGNHDSPPDGYQVWDLVTGDIIKHIGPDLFKWDPGQAHVLVYLVESHIEGVLDDVVEFDAATKTEKHFTTCPDWFDREFHTICQNLPGAVVGIQFLGFSDHVKVQILIYAEQWQDGNRPWYFGEREGNGSWPTVLRPGFGLTHVIKPVAAGYISMPLNYTVRISGTEAYVVQNGAVTQTKADHLVFYFEKSNNPTLTPTLAPPPYPPVKDGLLTTPPYP